jgi:hypothetical protein
MLFVTGRVRASFQWALVMVGKFVLTQASVWVRLRVMNWSILFWILYLASLGFSLFTVWPNGRSIALTVLLYSLLFILGYKVLGSLVH